MARDTASARWARDELDFCAEWDVVSLSEVADPERGITYGIVQPGPMTPGGVPIVRVNNVKGGRIETVDVHYVSHAIAAKYERTRLRGGEVLLTVVGTVGETAIVPPEMAGWNTARAVAVIPVKPEIGPEWVDLCLRSAPLQHLIDVWCTTTVQKTFNLKEVWELPIPLPPPKQRSAIARVLGGLDDKIELNRRMNRTLEDLARGLFRSWFVDFDPVIKNGSAKASAAPPGLFPKRLVDSPLGPIPEGWTIGSVADLARYVNGRNFTKNATGAGRMVVRIAELNSGPGGSTVYNDVKAEPVNVVQPGDLLFAWSGSLDVYRWNRDEALVNQHIFKVVCEAYPQWFVHFHLCEAMPFFQGIAADKATTMGHIKREHLGQAELALPPEAVLRYASAQIEPIYARLLANERESIRLAATRDALLPQLLSGEVRLRGGAAVVEEALA